MRITTENVMNALASAIGKAVQLDQDIALIESHLIIDSLALVRLFVELEKLTGCEIPADDAFELVNSSVKQITTKLNCYLEGRDEL